MRVPAPQHTEGCLRCPTAENPRQLRPTLHCQPLSPSRVHVCGRRRTLASLSDGRVCKAYVCQFDVGDAAGERQTPRSNGQARRQPRRQVRARRDPPAADGHPGDRAPDADPTRPRRADGPQYGGLRDGLPRLAHRHPGGGDAARQGHPGAQPHQVPGRPQRGPGRHRAVGLAAGGAAGRGQVRRRVRRLVRQGPGRRPHRRRVPPRQPRRHLARTAA